MGEMVRYLNTFHKITCGSRVNQLGGFLSKDLHLLTETCKTGYIVEDFLAHSGKKTFIFKF